MPEPLPTGSGAVSIGVVVGVKDEVEIIAASLAHLRQIGVDRIVVGDYGSTDGTLDVLASERRLGDVSVVHVDPDAVADYDRQSAHDLALGRALGTDWVISMDADEFWIPATGSLRTCESLQHADIVVAERYNVAVKATHLLMPATLTPSTYDTLELFTRRVAHNQSFIEAYPDQPIVSLVPVHKVMARPEVARAITPGGHDVHALTPDARRLVAPDVLVAHVMFSTRARFERKVRNIRAEIDRHPAWFANNHAWHWRRWAQMTPDQLAAEFNRQLADAARLEAWRKAGVLSSAAALLGTESAAADVMAAPAVESWWARMRHTAHGWLQPSPALRRADFAL